MYCHEKIGPGKIGPFWMPKLVRPTSTKIGPAGPILVSKIGPPCEIADILAISFKIHQTSFQKIVNSVSYPLSTGQVPLDLLVPSSISRQPALI